MEQHLLEDQRLEDALCEQKKTDMKEASMKLGQELDKQYDELQLEKEREVGSCLPSAFICIFSFVWKYFSSLQTT